MVLLLWHRPYIFRHVDFMSCHGFSALGTEPVLGPPIPKRLQWFRLTDQKLGNVFDAKRKDGDGLGLSLPRRRSHSGVRHAFTRTRDEPLRTSAWEATLAYNRLCNQCPISSTFSQGSLSSSLGTRSWDSLNQICGTPWLFNLPFTWANRSVPFTRKRPRRPETCIKEWNTNFRLQYSSRKNRGFSDVPLLPEIFSWVDRKSRVLFTFRPDFPENCCKW